MTLWRFCFSVDLQFAFKHYQTKRESFSKLQGVLRFDRVSTYKSYVQVYQTKRESFSKLQGVLRFDTVSHVQVTCLFFFVKSIKIVVEVIEPLRV